MSEKKDQKQQQPILSLQEGATAVRIMMGEEEWWRLKSEAVRIRNETQAATVGARSQN